MRRTSTIILVLAFTPSLLGQEYITKDGQLTQQLKIVQLQGGFAGFTGVQFIIEQDGSWTMAEIFNEKITPKKKGKFSEKDLAKLGSLLARYDFAKFPAKSGKQPGANPYILTMEFGKLKASLVGQEPPKLDPKNPTNSLESRFAGIWEGVVGLIKPRADQKEKKAP